MNNSYSSDCIIKLLVNRVLSCANADLNTCSCAECPLSDNFGDMKDLCNIIKQFDVDKES